MELQPLTSAFHMNGAALLEVVRHMTVEQRREFAQLLASAEPTLENRQDEAAERAAVEFSEKWGIPL